MLMHMPDTDRTMEHARRLRELIDATEDPILLVDSDYFAFFS